MKRFEKELLGLQAPATGGSLVFGRAEQRPGGRGRSGAGRRAPGRERRWRGPGTTVTSVLLPSLLAGLLLGAAAWHRFVPKYELVATVTCDFAGAEGPADLQGVIRRLQAPPLAAGSEKAEAAWQFGELLSIGSVYFEADAVASALRIRLETTQPQRAAQLAGDWIAERTASIGASDAPQRIAALLASLPGSDGYSSEDAGAYRRTLAALRGMRKRLVELQRARVETHGRLDHLQGQPLARGVVDPQDRRQALAADLGLQQDLRHLQTRTQEVRRVVLRDLAACLEAAEGIEPSTDALRALLDDLRARRVDAETAAVLARVGSFLERFTGRHQELRGVLSGSLEGLAQASVDEPQTVLDILDRLDSTVRLWTDSGREDVAAQMKLVDGLTEGQGSSVRRVLIHNRLRRGLFALEAGCRALSDRLGAVQRDWNFRLDALRKSVRGLSRRVAIQRRRIEERLQAEADRRVRLDRQAELASLERELEQARQAEQELLAGFLENFEAMTSLEGAAVREEVERQRQMWMSALRCRLEGFSKKGLEGVVLRGGPFAFNPEPLNRHDRVQQAATVGAAGGLACLLALAAFHVSRRLLAGEWWPVGRGNRRRDQ